MPWRERGIRLLRSRLGMTENKTVIELTTNGLITLLEEGLEADMAHAEMLSDEFHGEPHKAALAYDAMLFIRTAQEKISQLKGD